MRCIFAITGAGDRGTGMVACIDNDCDEAEAEAAKRDIRAVLPEGAYVATSGQTAWREHLLVKVGNWFPGGKDGKRRRQKFDFREGAAHGEIIFLNATSMPDDAALRGLQAAAALPVSEAVQSWLAEQHKASLRRVKRLNKLAGTISKRGGAPTGADDAAIREYGRNRWLARQVWLEPHRAEDWLMHALALDLPADEAERVTLKAIEDSIRDGRYLLEPRRDGGPKLTKKAESFAFKAPFRYAWDGSDFWVLAPVDGQPFWRPALARVWRQIGKEEFASEVAAWLYAVTQETEVGDWPVRKPTKDEPIPPPVRDEGPPALRFATGAIGYEAFARFFRQRAARLIRPEGVNSTPGIVALPDGTIHETYTGVRRLWRESDGVIEPIAIMPETGEAATIRAFLQRKIATDEERDWFMDFFLYCLVADGGSQSFMYLKGEPQTGKSLLVSMIVDVLGDSLAIAVDEGDLLPARGAKPHSGWIKRLAQRRLGYCDEVRSERVQWSPGLKKLTENKFMSGRGLYERHGEVKPLAAIVVAANHRPWAPPGDGIFRRTAEFRIENETELEGAALHAELAAMEAELPAFLHQILQRGKGRDIAQAVYGPAMPQIFLDRQDEAKQAVEPLRPALRRVYRRVEQTRGGGILVEPDIMTWMHGLGHDFADLKAHHLRDSIRREFGKDAVTQSMRGRPPAKVWVAWLEVIPAEEGGLPL